MLLLFLKKIRKKMASCIYSVENEHWKRFRYFSINMYRKIYIFATQHST